MFDSNRRGWLIKLIEAVEEDAMDAIVDDEDDIVVEAICSVEAICGSDNMKKQISFREDHTDLWLKHTKSEKEKMWERERKREKVKRKSERESERESEKL